MSDPVLEIMSGDWRRGLVALRDELARRLPECPARELPAVARRLQSLMVEIEEVQPPSGISKAEELRQRRAQRQLDAAASREASVH